MNTPAKEVTRLLQDLSHGDQDAAAELVPLLYNELRRLAASYLRSERSNHTLQPTALVHEAYLRLVDQKDMQWKNRNHFLAVAAQSMRRILVDYARGHQAAKRGGAAPKVSLNEAVIVSKERVGDLVALDEILTCLAAIDPQQVRVVELRFFGGLTVEETAEVIGTSPATVKRDWTMAKAWLAREMRRGSSSEADEGDQK